MDVLNLSPVAPREGRVSRNFIYFFIECNNVVAPREGRVSRNGSEGQYLLGAEPSRPARGV